MIKRILVPLDPSPFSKVAIKHACRIARTHDAVLTGLVIVDSEGIKGHVAMIKPYQYDYTAQMDKRMEQQAHERVAGLLAGFSEICERDGVRHREAERQGSPSQHIIGEAIYYDLLIMGLRTFYGFETSPRPGDSLEIVLDHCVTPVFAVPEKMNHQEFKRVVIAFDGTQPAARALHDFVQLASPLDCEVRIVMSRADADEASLHLDQAKNFLHAHDVNVVETIWTPESIIKAMLERYLYDVDLIVLGAHSKNALLDFMIGSLSRTLIEEAKVPLLIGL